MPAASVRPFAMPDYGAASSGCSDHRAWVLLDTKPCSGCRKNETTAAAWTSTGHAVEVSVALADPPAISRCFIHCDGLTPSQFTTEPRVIRAEGALLLLRMTFAPPWTDLSGKPITDVFVYNAGPRNPSLYLLPRTFPPPPLHSTDIALLPAGGVDGEHFRVVIPTGWFNRDPVLYNLDIFSSRSKLWTSKQIPVSTDAETRCKKLDRHQSTKVISLGGGCLGWVDLSQGILICDVLADEPVMRLMQFPEPEPSKKLNCEMGFDSPSARAIRDVTCSDGVVRFVQIECCQSGYGIEEGYGGWVATMWCREVTSKDWSSCLKVDSCDVNATSSCLPCLLPEMCDMETSKLNLNKVIITCPTLGLNDDGVMYMISKLNHEDPRTFVLAINTKRRTLEGIAEVSGERISIDPTYICCSFSQCPSMIPGADMVNQLENSIWRKEPEQLAVYVMMLLLAEDQFRQLERILTYKSPSYLECRSLLHSGLATTLFVHIQELAQFATSNGRGKAISEAVAIYLQLHFDGIHYFSFCEKTGIYGLMH